MTSPASESLKEIHIRLDARMRSVDEPRWLSSRYAMPDHRNTLIILYAFYYELARVRVAVTDQTMGQIRFQWWRDALNELKRSETRQHDVVLALAHEVQADRLQLSDLMSLIDSHETAFLEQDRAREPEDGLIAIAGNVFSPVEPIGPELVALAQEWAALRRNQGPSALRARQKVPSELRPSVAHLRLRHLWHRNRDASALRVRACLLMAMLTGRV